MLERTRLVGKPPLTNKRHSRFMRSWSEVAMISSDGVMVGSSLSSLPGKARSTVSDWEKGKKGFAGTSMCASVILLVATQTVAHRVLILAEG
jgi:hypothetical protein